MPHGNLLCLAGKEKVRELGIIGIGNTLMGDDGVGVRLLELLEGGDLPQGVNVVNIGTNVMALLHSLTCFDAVIILDAVDFGGRPGQALEINPDDVISKKELLRLSTHESDVLNIIRLSRELGECPEDIRIFAVQPFSMNSGEGLSPRIQRLLPRYQDDIMKLVDSML